MSCRGKKMLASNNERGARGSMWKFQARAQWFRRESGLSDKPLPSRAASGQLSHTATAKKKTPAAAWAARRAWAGSSLVLGKELFAVRRNRRNPAGRKRLPALNVHIPESSILAASPHQWSPRQPPRPHRLCCRCISRSCSPIHGTWRGLSASTSVC